MGGLILIKSVLQSITIYWMHIYKIPKGTVKRINSIIANFLWSGVGADRKTYLIRLEVLACRVDKGGWNIKDLERFNMALLIKNIGGQ